jgi:hypothetical protein
MNKKAAHMDKINGIESQIFKHTNYDVQKNKEKNIMFLLDNANLIDIEEEDIKYYIFGYNHLVIDKKARKKLHKYFEKENDRNSKNINLSRQYDRMVARNYAHIYCGKKLGVFDSEGYNIAKYPVFDTVDYPHNDCANFASQCIFAGGKVMSGTRYGDADAWFCNTKNPSKLPLISYTWRATGGFKTYWKVRSNYSEVKMKDAYNMKDFTKNVFKQLYYGDIVQLADEYGAPWHTLNVTAYSTGIDGSDIGYTTHSVNRKDESLFSMIDESDNLLLLYHMI